MSTMGTMERILRLMAEKKASDVYLSAHSPALIRINGQCVPINNQALPPDAPRNLLGEILPPQRLAELDATGELNMGFPLEGVGRFRLSAMHQRGSAAAVIRFISNEIPPLAGLSLPPILGDLIMEKRGLLLMVGATGMGKSTTLAAMIEHRNENASGHILTIEDPIEFLFRNKRSVINQREIGTDTASLQVALSNALRQAPDVIMIGEIRDFETAQIAIQASLTGHLVLATLHTNDAASAVNRLIDMGVEPFLLSSSLLGVLAQRLVRKLCLHCRVNVAGAWTAPGCDHCGQTGYAGRSGVFELLVTDDAIRAQIHSRSSEADIRAAALAAGMTLMRDDGERLVQGGLTSREELVRVTRD